MIVGKWNYETKKYDPHFLPKTCILYSSDLEKETTCAQCGEVFKIGECYTSKEIHNHYGLGFPVDKKCYDEEWERYRLSKQK